MAGIGASSNTTRLAYVPETIWGVTPATPAFENLRITSESLAPEKSTIRSNEMRPDRNTADEILTGISAGGSIETEMSYGTFDDLLEALLQGTWTSDVLVNGVLERFFSIEKTNDAPGGTKVYQRFAGTMVNTLNLSVTAQQLITGSWGVMSKDYQTGVAAITGATYAEANSNDVLSASAHFADLESDALSDGIALESLTLDITNNLRQRAQVGELGMAGIGSGRFEVSGSMNAYFSSMELLEIFRNHGEIDLSFVMGTAAGSRYRVRLPRLKFSTGSLVAGGNDSDLMLATNFTALYEGDLEGTIEITRGV